MKKHAIFYLLIISLFFSMNVLNVNANETETDKNEKRVTQSLYTQIEQLQNDIQSIKNEESKKTYELLLQREKDISSSLYDFTMFFVVIITLFVTISGVAITVLLNKLNKHQKKINLVLNSKEFDEKLKQIENRLDKIRLKERENYKNEVISQIKKLIANIEEHIRRIEEAKDNSDVQDVEKIKEEYDFKGLKLEAEKVISEFKILELVTLSTDDEISDSILPEEQLSQFAEQLIPLRDKLRKLDWQKLYPV